VLPTLASPADEKPYPRAPALPSAYVRLERARRLAWRSRGRYERAAACRAAGARHGGIGHGAMPDDLARVLPRWWGRGHYVRALRRLAEQPEVAAVCRQNGIAVRTWLAIATNDALDARDGGRIMSTSQAIAAARVNRSEEAVKRARKVSVLVGVAIEVYRGRQLGQIERVALLRRSPGHKQRGLPSVLSLGLFPPQVRRRIAVPEFGRWAQVFPQLTIVDDSFVPLPSFRKVHLKSYLINDSLLQAAGAAVEKEEAPPPQKKRWRPPPGYVFAAELLAERDLQPFLCAVSPSRSAALLLPHSRGGWTPPALAQALRTEADRRRLHVWEPATSPYGALKMLLQSVDVDARAHFTLGVAAEPPAPLTPCGGADCDGHGWIFVADTRGYESARPCPECPPGLRAGRPPSLAGPM
jgi:hypothetical protein